MSEQSDQEETPGAYLIQGNVIRNPNQLNLRFYEGYDHKFLYRKAQTLMHIVTEHEHFKEQIRKGEERSEDSIYNYLHSQDIDEKYFESLRAEVYFTEMHQFESLFALAIAAFQVLPHWLYLTIYKPGAIRTAANLFLDGKIAELTHNQVSTKSEFVASAIYTGFTFEEDSRWETNLDNIVWLLDRMAKKYVEATEYRAGEYNAYKHGLRVLTGPTSLQVATSPQGPYFVIGASDNSLSFLKREDLGEGGMTILEVTKHFNPEESFVHLHIMQLILEEIKNTRLAKMKNEPLTALGAFIDLDKEQIEALRVNGYWHFTA